MRIKRFFAEDMRQAIGQVRGELGSDAVILSNRQVAGGIELVAAVDYDEALLDELTPQGRASGSVETHTHATDRPPRPAVHESTSEAVGVDSADVSHEPRIVWSQEPTLMAMRQELESLKGMVAQQLSGLAWGELGRRHPMRMKLLRHLMAVGLSPALCQTIADKVADTSDYHTLWRQAIGELARQLPTTDDDIVTNGGVVALLGPTGVGKTTTVAKLAARCVLRYGAASVGLVTTDRYRIGAHEQLRVFGRILNIPVRVAGGKDELHEILDSLHSRRLVLIDTAGTSQRDVRLSEQFALLANEAVLRNFLVLSATTQTSVLDEAVRAFRSAGLQGCIITKIDEAASLGGALSAVIQNALPVAYVTDGQRVPEDIRPARANNIINRSIQIAKESGQRLSDEWLALSFEDVMVNANG